jgi:hypothetical protein
VICRFSLRSSPGGSARASRGNSARTRVTWKRIAGSIGYELIVADNDAYIEIDNGEIGWKRQVIKAMSRAEFLPRVAEQLVIDLIPTLKQIADGRKKRAKEAERFAAEQAEGQRIRRIERAGVNLYEALKYVAANSGEKTIRAKAEAAITKAEG